MRQSHSSMLAVTELGPIHFTNSSGSVWARISCSGVALKSRVIRTIGRSGTASICASA